MPGGRALGALCAEKPFLTSAIMELRVPQVRRLPVCISRVDTTHKCLSLFEALGRPRPLIFAHAFCATHAHSPSTRSIGFCVIWVCISSSSSSFRFCEEHHYIWPLGPFCVAKRAREHFKSKQGVYLTPTLERNAPWSRRTVSLRSRRQRERPKSTGHREGNHHYIWPLGPSCVAKRAREHFKSKQGIHLTPTLDAPWSRRRVSFCLRVQCTRSFLVCLLLALRLLERSALALHFFAVECFSFRGSDVFFTDNAQGLFSCVYF